jgi:hypothetical protein
MTISQHTVTGQDVDLDQLIAEYAQIVPPLNEAQASAAVRVWQLLAKGAPVTLHALAAPSATTSFSFPPGKPETSGHARKDATTSSCSPPSRPFEWGATCGMPCCSCPF